MSAGALNVNVACLACDGTRPCAQCRAVGKALASAGHRVHRSSRYAALRAAADGTYGFSACVLPLAPGERAVADAIVALLPGMRVAIATDDANMMPAPLPEGFVTFPQSDFAGGRLPHAWLDSLKDRSPERSSLLDRGEKPERSSALDRSDATRRLRAVAATQRPEGLSAQALLDDELAWYRASGIGFALIFVRTAGAAADARPAIERVLRTGDSIAATEDGLIAVLPGTDEKASKAVVKRALKAAASHFAGVAVCPHDGVDALGLLTVARERATGG